MVKAYVMQFLLTTAEGERLFAHTKCKILFVLFFIFSHSISILFWLGTTRVSAMNPQKKNARIPWSEEAGGHFISHEQRYDSLQGKTKKLAL